MKVLYAIQGTGNGHLARAREIVPYLKKKCEVDVLISGTQFDIDFSFDIKYCFKGLGFVFGKKGGVDIWNTYIKTKLKRFRKEVKSLPVTDYNLVINDFEPVSAWAAMKMKIPCISLSHQCALIGKNVPKAKKSDPFSSFILKNYAPSHKSVGFHFVGYSKNIFTPIIRTEIRNIERTEKEHYTVYLPSFNDEKLLNIFSEFENEKWQIFSKHNKGPFKKRNIEILPLSNDAFINSMAASKGVICGAGFETPAEAMYLGKKLLVVPMSNQFEQHYNAAALKTLGVKVIKKINKINYPKIKEWIDSDFKIEIEYPDITNTVINRVFEIYVDNILKMKLSKRKLNLKI